MWDHVGLRVSDRAASKRFYELVLGVLGYDITHSTGHFDEWNDFGIAQASDEKPVTQNLHVAFVARSRADVDAFWRAGVDAGYTSDGEPGERPQYSETYYGGFLLDPDGNSAEAIHTEEPRPGDNYIDHMWIGVSDLDATKRFYATIAPVVGVRIANTRPGALPHRRRRPLVRARARRAACRPRTCISPSACPTTRPSTSFIASPWRRASKATGRPVSGPSTTPVTTARSSSTLTATTSRPSVTTARTRSPSA